MIKRYVPLLFLVFSFIACTSNIRVSAPAEDETAWMKAFRGEEVFIVTQGTVAVDAVNFMKGVIPGARWSARFDYDPDVSANYLVLDFSEERSGTPLEPVIQEMFSGIPRSGTLQVNSNRIRLGYFSASNFEEWTVRWESALKAYGKLIEDSLIEETQGPWYGDPSQAYLKETRDKQSGETFLTAVNYKSGEEKTLIRYELAEGRGQGSFPWMISLEDLTGRIEWISGLVTPDIRPGENLSGFYGALDGGYLDFSGTSERTFSSDELSLVQADLEFGNDLIMTWVKGRGLRKAYPNDSSSVRITGEARGSLVSGFDLSGRPFPLFLLVVDYRTNRVQIETDRRIRHLELPLVFNETSTSEGVGRVYTFNDLRADYEQELTLPVTNLQSLRIGKVGKDDGFVDLYDGRFFTFDDEVPPEISIDENSLILFSNRLPFGDISNIAPYISFFPPLDILSVDSDLILYEDGESEYYLRIETSPMEPGETYQVTTQPHPTLFDQGYVWEFRAD